MLKHALFLTFLSSAVMAINQFRGQSNPNTNQATKKENSSDPVLWYPKVRAAIKKTTTASTITLRDRLLEKLLKGYHKGSIPVSDPSDQLKVQVRAELFQITDVRLASNTIKATAALQMFWNDSYLQWDPDNFDGASSIYLPAHDVWTPELSIYYSADSAFMSVPNDFLEVKVTYQGGVSFVSSFTVHTLCPFDCKYFPFDSHRCEIVFGSLVHTVDTLDVVPLNPVILDNFYDNQEWLLDGCRMEKGYIQLLGFGSESRVGTFTILLDIHRQSFFYIFVLVCPSTLSTFLAIVGFHIPHAPVETRSAKFQLGQITLLSMAVLLVGISTELPRFAVKAIPGKRGSFSHVPLLGIFYLSLLVLVMASTLTCSMLVLLEKEVQRYDSLNSWLDSFSGISRFTKFPSMRSKKGRRRKRKQDIAEEEVDIDHDITFFRAISGTDPMLLSPDQLVSASFDRRHFAHQLYLVIRKMNEANETLKHVHETLTKTNIRSIRARRAGLLARRVEKYLFVVYLVLLLIILCMFFNYHWWY